MMYFDAESSEEKELTLFLLRNQFVTPRGVRIYDDEDESAAVQNRALEQEAQSNISDYLKKLTSKENDVQNTD